MSLNRILIMGRLTKDPELRHTQSGTSVASFTLACDRDFRDKQSGERMTDFIDVVAWRHTGEFAAQYFAKGRMAVVDGRLQIREWTDKEGNKRRTPEIVADNLYFGDSKSESRDTYDEPGCNAAAPQKVSRVTMDQMDDDGELPF
nr:MAG TPA: Single strand binding protein [Caudoviricetes sp.]